MMKLEEMETKINMLAETVGKLEARLKNTEDAEAVKKLQKAYNYYLQRWQFEEIYRCFLKVLKLLWR